ncbi:histone H1-like [Amblyomma americanum]
MAEETSTAAPAAAPAAPTSPKKKAPRSSGKPRPAASHPKVSAMVTASIGALKERGGSSLQAIKKHMAATYKVDVEKLSPFIRKYLKSAVAAGALVQTKGKGASGSFKLANKGAAAAEKKPAKKAAKKPRAKKPKAAAAGAAKKASPKKAPKKPKAAPAKKPKAEKKASLPKKPKKPAAKKAATPKKAAKK